MRLVQVDPTTTCKIPPPRVSTLLGKLPSPPPPIGLLLSFLASSPPSAQPWYRYSFRQQLFSVLLLVCFMVLFLSCRHMSPLAKSAVGLSAYPTLLLSYNPCRTITRHNSLDRGGGEQPRRFLDIFDDVISNHSTERLVIFSRLQTCGACGLVFRFQLHTLKSDKILSFRKNRVRPVILEVKSIHLGKGQQAKHGVTRP